MMKLKVILLLASVLCSYAAHAGFLDQLKSASEDLSKGIEKSKKELDSVDSILPDTQSPASDNEAKDVPSNNGTKSPKLAQATQNSSLIKRSDTIGRVEGTVNARYLRNIVRPKQMYYSGAANIASQFGFISTIPLTIDLVRSSYRPCTTFSLDKDYLVEAVMEFNQTYGNAKIELLGVERHYGAHGPIGCTFKEFKMLATDDSHTAFVADDQPDLGKLSQILGISLLSSKAEVDAMIATTGKNWQCQRVDNPESKRSNGRTVPSSWRRTCMYQNPSNLMQHQRFEVEAMGNTIFRILFEDRVFDFISLDEWKKQPAQLKAAYGPSLDDAHSEVLKTQDTSSPGQYREIDAGLKLTIESECHGRPLDITISTIMVSQGALTSGRFLAEYGNYRSMCRQ